MSIERKLVNNPRICIRDIDETKKPEIPFGLRGETLPEMLRPAERHTDGSREATRAQKS